MDKIKTGFLNIGLKFLSIDEKIFRMIFETSPSNVREIVILPAVKIVMEKLVKKLENKKKHGIVYNGNLEGVEVSIIQSFMGCPYIAEKMECLKFTKCKTVLRVDFCGGLDLPGESVEPGKLVIPDSSLCGDGTSPHYINKYYDQLKDLDFIDNPIESMKRIKVGSERIYKAFPSSEINEIMLKTARRLYSNKILSGPIWTTDSLFCETDDEVNSWKNAGILAIDMESSLLFLLGKLFNIKISSVLSISDIPGHDKYDMFKSNYIHPDLFVGIDRSIEIVIKSLKDIKKIP